MFPFKYLIVLHVLWKEKSLIINVCTTNKLYIYNCITNMFCLLFFLEPTPAKPKEKPKTPGESDGMYPDAWKKQATLGMNMPFRHMPNNLSDAYWVS